MMNKKHFIFIFVLVFLVSLNLSAKKKDKYEKWMDEVNSIIADAEKAEVYSPLILRFFYLCRI